MVGINIMKEKLVIHKGLEVGASVKHGYGVFSTEFIPAGATVEVCMCCIQTIPFSSGILANYRFAGPLASAYIIFSPAAL